MDSEEEREVKEEVEAEADEKGGEGKVEVDNKGIMQSNRFSQWSIPTSPHCA
jgi:hypothetical protein